MNSWQEPLSFSGAVDAALRAAGWQPNQCRTRTRNAPPTEDIHRWREFIAQFAPSTEHGAFPVGRTDDHAARQALHELFGLRIVPHSGEVLRSDLHFDPAFGVACADEIQGLGKLLHDVLVPIGEVISESIIVQQSSGPVFLLGWVGVGVFYAGKDIQDGLEKLLASQRLPPVLFDWEAAEGYQFPETTPSTPGVVLASDLIARRLPY